MIEDSNASGVTFLYETDPKNILSGTFKNVHENGIGPILSEKAREVLEEAITGFRGK